MKTVEPLLYVVDVIWVVEDLFWLAVAVSFDFLFTHTYLEGLAECFSSVVPFQVCCWRCWCMELLLETQRAKFIQKGRIFPTWTITDLFIKLFYVIIRRCRINGGGRVRCCLHLFLSPCLACWWRMQWCDSVVAGVVRLGDFPRLERSMEIWHSLEQS